MFNILQTLAKLKSAVSVIIDHDKHNLMPQIQKIYYKTATVFLDDRDKEKFDDTKGEFLKFLERDQRNTLKESRKPENQHAMMLELLNVLKTKRLK
jgi:hypothetical protein